MDIDSPHPELLNQLKERHHEIELPAYRSTGVANASTPPTQRFVWLLVNVPAPHLIANGLRLAQWDPDVDALREKQGQRRGRGGEGRAAEGVEKEGMEREQRREELAEDGWRSMLSVGV